MQVIVTLKEGAMKVDISDIYSYTREKTTKRSIILTEPKKEAQTNHLIGFTTLTVLQVFQSFCHSP